MRSLQTSPPPHLRLALEHVVAGLGAMVGPPQELRHPCLTPCLLQRPGLHHRLQRQAGSRRLALGPAGKDPPGHPPRGRTPTCVSQGRRGGPGVQRPSVGGHLPRVRRPCVCSGPCVGVPGSGAPSCPGVGGQAGLPRPQDAAIRGSRDPQSRGRAEAEDKVFFPQKQEGSSLRGIS